MFWLFWLFVSFSFEISSKIIITDRITYLKENTSRIWFNLFSNTPYTLLTLSVYLYVMYIKVSACLCVCVYAPDCVCVCACNALLVCVSQKFASIVFDIECSIEVIVYPS